MDIKLRPLSLSDSAFCRALASEPAVRSQSLDGRAPTFWGHVKWMWRWTMRVNDRRAWIIVFHYGTGWAETDAGLVRASKVKGGGSEIGIAVDGRYRGEGIGTMTLCRAGSIIASVIGSPVYARIKYTNRASVKAFKKAGYREASPGPWRRISGDDPTVMVLEWKP